MNYYIANIFAWLSNENNHSYMEEINGDICQIIDDLKEESKIDSETLHLLQLLIDVTSSFNGDRSWNKYKEVLKTK